MEPVEQVLTGGNVAGEVVRVGATVRKPATPATPAVEALLTHLAERGSQGRRAPWAGTSAGGTSSSTCRARWPTRCRR